MAVAAVLAVIACTACRHRYRVLTMIVMPMACLSQDRRRKKSRGGRECKQEAHGRLHNAAMLHSPVRGESRGMGASMAGELLKIGAVAQQSGVPVKTIRFYCDEGLLLPASRSQGRYRLFDQNVFSELALIRNLRAMDLPLIAVHGVLTARRSGVCTCADLQATIRGKLDEIQGRLEDLQALESDLQTMLASWQSCGGR